MAETNRRDKLIATLMAVGLLATTASTARAEEILVSAAASLTEAMNRIGKDFTRANPNVVVRFNFGASGALQKQIENGAPADVFASAGAKEMDALAVTGGIDLKTRIDFAGNRLVLIVPASSGIHRWEEIAGAGVKRVALSNPASVPSGRYAREVLEKKGMWQAVQAKSVFGENVRQTLAYVARGDVDAGIVFASDALIERDRVKVAQTAVPGKDHAPIAYPAAVVARTRHPELAAQFVAFLRSTGAQAIVERAGFVPIAAARKK